MNHSILARSFFLFCGFSMLIGCQGVEAESDSAADDAAEALAAKDWTPPQLSNPNAVSVNPDAPQASQGSTGVKQAAAAANWYADTWLIGGPGGGAGNTKNWNAGPIKTLEVWAGGSSLRGIKITHWNGDQYSLGQLTDRYSRFDFAVGEKVTSCSLWGNGAGTRHGGFRIKTNKGREFFPHMYDWGLKTEYPVPVGSGFMVGANWRAGNDIDAFGFVFVNNATRVAIAQMNYNNKAKGESIGQGQAITLGTVNYTNTGTQSASYTIGASKTYSATTSFTNEFGIEIGAQYGFEGGVPEVAKTTTTFSLTTSYQFSKTRSTTEDIGTNWSVTASCPAKSKCWGSATLHAWTEDLPYTGIMKYYLTNGATYWHPIRGVYHGALNSELQAKSGDSKL